MWSSVGELLKTQLQKTILPTNRHIGWNFVLWWRRGFMSYCAPSNQAILSRQDASADSVPLMTVCCPFVRPGVADSEARVRFPVQGLSEFTCSPRVCVGSTRVVSKQCATHIVSILISCIDTALRWTGNLSPSVAMDNGWMDVATLLTNQQCYYTTRDVVKPQRLSYRKYCDCWMGSWILAVDGRWC